MGLPVMSDFTVVAWNSRGCNSAPRARQITEFVRHNKVSIIGVLESKIQKVNESEVCKRLLPGWQFCTNSTNADPGRIWLAWNQREMDVDILYVDRKSVV